MIYIGTSGYHYDHWKNIFYPSNLKKKDWLEYYSTYFETVELNVTFYRLPTRKAFDAWYHEVPINFVYSVKGSRYITHTKRLLNVEKSLALFMKRAESLKDKLAIILWQFPKNERYNFERFEKFLNMLDDFGYRNAFEFRNETWFNQELYELLNKHNYSLVFADSPGNVFPKIITADYLYVRFHGGKLLYTSEYSLKEIKGWAKKIDEWSKNKDIYVYFNNDASGYAINNALMLKTELDKY